MQQPDGGEGGGATGQRERERERGGGGEGSVAGRGGSGSTSKFNLGPLHWNAAIVTVTGTDNFWKRNLFINNTGIESV